MQNHTDILKILFFLPKYALGKDKVSDNCSIINCSEMYRNAQKLLLEVL